MLSVPPLLAVLLCAGLASATCPTNHEWYSYNGYCYWRSINKLRWYDAKIQCPHEATGAYLASFRSLKENDAIMQHYNHEDSWIGLDDGQQEGLWQWCSGEAVNWTNWQGGQPDNGNWAFSNEDCVHVPHQYHNDYLEDKWDDGDCGDLLHYICKVKAT